MSAYYFAMCFSSHFCYPFNYLGWHRTALNNIVPLKFPSSWLRPEVHGRGSEMISHGKDFNDKLPQSARYSEIQTSNESNIDRRGLKSAQHSKDRLHPLPRSQVINSIITATNRRSVYSDPILSPSLKDFGGSFDFASRH